MGERVAQAPRLLIVSAFFPPSRKIGGRRPARFARHLAERGWDVSVLTPHASYGPPVDLGWTPPPGVHILRTHAFVPGNTLRRAASALHRLTAGSGRKSPAGGAVAGRPSTDAAQKSGAVNGSARPLRDLFWRTVSRAEFPDRWVGWKPFALSAARGLRFDAVLATLPPYSPALIGREIAKRQGAIFALDYRDPWTEAPRTDWDPALYAHLIDRHRRAEDACLGDADLVLATSPTIGRWLAPRAGIEPVFAPNSFDDRDTSPRTRSKTLVYTGTLAYGRSLAPVLAAMSQLAKAEAAESLELVYAGTEGPQVVAEAARFGMSDRVRNLGYVPARESDALSKDALAAIVVVTPRYEYMLPGKLFEIVASGTPLLLIAPENADVAAICRRYRLGWHHVPEDVDGIANSLRRALAGEVPVPSGVEALGTEHVIDTIDRELKAALSRGPRTARALRRA